MEKKLKSFKALEYLLIKYNLIDKFVMGKYVDGKWCLNCSFKNMYEICLVENGQKTMKSAIRYPEFACCYVLEVLDGDNIKELIKEYCYLIGMDDNKFKELTCSLIMQHEIEQNLQSKSKSTKTVVKKDDALTKEHNKAKRMVNQSVRIRKK